jgi:hypothetical protein
MRLLIGQYINEKRVLSLMPCKVEPPTPLPQSTPSPSYYRALWDAANFITVALATSTAVVCVQSPIKTMITSLSKSNVLFPAYQGGLLGCVRMLYTGTQATLGSSSLRVAYATGTKTNKGDSKEEVVQAERYARAAYVALAALGELLLIQIPSSLADYRKINIIPTGFKWWTPYNVVQLIKGNFAIKYGSSLVSCYSLCIIEPKYADYFYFTTPTMTRFLSGACSGMTAALLNYPLAVFVDYTQVRTVVKDGKLVNKGPLNSFKDLNRLFGVDPKASLFSFVFNAGKQIPLRVVSSAAVFSMISGIGNALGQEPLQTIVPERYIPSPGRHPSTFFKNIPDSPVNTPANTSVPESRQTLK